MTIFAKWNQIPYNIIPAVLQRHNMMILDPVAAFLPAIAADRAEKVFPFCFCAKIPVPVTHDCILPPQLTPAIMRLFFVYYNEYLKRVNPYVISKTLVFDR